MGTVIELPMSAVIREHAWRYTLVAWCWTKRAALAGAIVAGSYYGPQEWRALQNWCGQKKADIGRSWLADELSKTQGYCAESAKCTPPKDARAEDLRARLVYTAKRRDELQKANEALALDLYRYEEMLREIRGIAANAK